MLNIGHIIPFRETTQSKTRRKVLRSQYNDIHYTLTFPVNNREKFSFHKLFYYKMQNQTFFNNRFSEKSTKNIVSIIF